MACGTGGSCSTGGGGGCRSTGTTLAWQRLGLDEILEAIYPNRTWGELDHEAVRSLAPTPRQRREMAARFAAFLSRPVHYRPGADEDYCDLYYVRIKPRPGDSGLSELRDGAATLVPLASSEVHLRIAVSTLAPLAHVRQVRLSAIREPGLLLIEESVPTRVNEPGARFYERRLTATSGALADVGLSHLDVRLLDGPLEGYHPGRYAELYGGEPTLAAFLFSPQPSDVASTEVVPFAEGLGDSSSASERPRAASAA
jgi:hypothetical protein